MRAAGTCSARAPGQKKSFKPLVQVRLGWPLRPWTSTILYVVSLSHVVAGAGAQTRSSRWALAKGWRSPPYEYRTLETSEPRHQSPVVHRLVSEPTGYWSSCTESIMITAYHGHSYQENACLIGFLTISLRYGKLNDIKERERQSRQA
jgi:hypothetical protein